MGAALIEAPFGAVGLDMGAQEFERIEVEAAGGPPLSALRWSGGDGVSVLCVHGADGSAANWIDLAPLLGAERAVLAVDLPGFGRTPVVDRRPSMAAYADLIGELAGRAPGGRSVLACNSMGAVVGVLAAARHPAAVAGLALIAPAVPRAGRAPIDPTMLPMLAPFLVPGLMSLEARRRHRLPPEQRTRELLDMCFAPGNRESPAAWAEMVDVARRRELRDQAAGWTKAFRSLVLWLIRRRAFHAEADRIRCPVTIADGAADPIIPSSSIAAAIERHPGWSRTSLEGVGHVPQLEDAHGTAAALRILLD